MTVACAAGVRDGAQRPAARRFWARVRKDGDCLVWGGSTAGGYGTIRVNRRLERTHRFAWVLAHGPVPGGLHVLHRCDNRRCVNVSHLFLGTNADNIADRVAKGRSWRPRGERNGRAKLTVTDVRLIRALRADGWLQVPLARRFGVSQRLVSLIVRGENWNDDFYDEGRG